MFGMQVYYRSNYFMKVKVLLVEDGVSFLDIKSK